MNRAAPSVLEKADKTAHRLLEAAGEVFAEKGFRCATVREICRRAGANVAAVNYHFRDKEDLYVAVLRYTHRFASERYPPDWGLEGPDPSPEDRLRAFVRSFLARILDSGRPAWHGKLMAREMAEPTRALDMLVADAVRPNAERLAAILRDLLPGADAEEIRLASFSVVGQCLYFHFARPVIARLHPSFAWDDADRERVAEHITAFSLAALRGEGRSAKRRMSNSKQTHKRKKRQ